MHERRKQWLRSIHAVEAQVNYGPSNYWIRGEINQKKIEDDTLVIIATFPSQKHAWAILASRVIDVRGAEVAYQQRVITVNRGQGVMLKITIPIYEVTA